MDNKEDLAFDKYNCCKFSSKLPFSPLYPIYLAQRRFPPKKPSFSPMEHLPFYRFLTTTKNRVSYTGPTQTVNAVVRPSCNTGPVGPAGVTPVSPLSTSNESLSSLSLSDDNVDYLSSDDDIDKPELLTQSMIHSTYIRNPRTTESLDDSGIVERSCDETDWVIVKNK
jgi:hypothetical protein